MLRIATSSRLPIASPVGGQIGPFLFHTIDGVPDRPKPIYRNITSPFEDGIAVSPDRFGSDAATLLTRVDVLTQGLIDQTIKDYISIMLDVVSIFILANSTYVQYEDYWVLDVREVDPGDEKFAQVVSGGLAGGQFTVLAQWTVISARGIGS